MAGYISMDSVSDIKLNGVDVEKITQGVNTLWEKSVIEPFNIKNISQSVATVDWNTGADNRNLQYSDDKTTWTSVPYADGKYSITIPVGKKYYFQGNSTNFGGWWGSDEDVEISGYVLSLHYPTMEQPSNQSVSYQNLFAKNGNGTADGKLHFNFSKLKLPVKRVMRYGYNNTFKGCLSITELNYDIFYTNSTVATAEYAFALMFQNCTNLTRIDGFTLNRFTNLGAWSEFRQMFEGCTSLEYVWDGMFDTTVTPQTGFWRDSTCYCMFNGCTSLTHPPKLPAVRGSKVFDRVFMGCTSLTTAASQRVMPDYTEIGTQSGQNSMTGMFQYMFSYCTGLTSMHDLSSYTMRNLGTAYFQGMYYGCTGITSIDAAKMPSGVATANCFNGMFYGCTGITSVPSGFIKPTNTANACYANMFMDCTSLTSVSGLTLPATELAVSCYENMFRHTGITAAPTMTVNSVAPGCCRHIFCDSNSLSDVSGISLNAMTMETECYRGMFYGNNTALTTPLTLPSTTLAEGCYWGMYDGCVNLEGTVTLPSETLYHYSYATMFKGCNKLQGIEVGFKTWNSDYTLSWVDGITNNTGVFTCPEELPWTTGSDYIPTNWTINIHYVSETPTITHDAYDIIIVNNTLNQGGTIYYTTDGSTPNEYSTIYTGPFPASIGDTIKAICIYQGVTSEVASWTVATSALPAPTITGNNDNVILVSNDTTDMGVLYYTTDGTTPTSSSTQYTGAFQVTSGTTVKAIYINMGAYLYTDSAVTEQRMYPCVEQKFIHNATMIQNANINNYGISTGVYWDKTVKFRYKGKYVYEQSSAVVGLQNDNNSRLYMNNGVLYYNLGGSNNVSYDYKTPEMLDLTVGNKYVIDNNTNTTLMNIAAKNITNNKLIFVDVTSLMFHSLQIWKTINNVETLVFDGVAAELNGEYGIYDKVSGQLLTRAGITIVPEVGNLYFENRASGENYIQCTKEGTDTQWLSLEYSHDEKNWSSWDLTQTLIIPAFGRVYLRGNNTTYGFGKDTYNYNMFNCQYNYALGGDLFSIMDSSVTGYPARFATKTFYQSTTLVDASQLYFGTKTILATTFIQTFEGCEHLERVPNVIGVSYASNVNFSTHTSHFSGMFRNDPIANFPKFPNINTIGRDGMFGIAKDPLNTPTLDYVDLSSITTLYYRGLYEAFRNQGNLEVVKIGISAWPEFLDSTASDYTATLEWLYGVHSTGVFCKNSTLPVMRGDNYIPYGWSIADIYGFLLEPIITNLGGGDIGITEGGDRMGRSSTIYYTTDGSLPDTTSNVYSDTFNVPSGTTIRAFAVFTPVSSRLQDVIYPSPVVTYTVQ